MVVGSLPRTVVVVTIPTLWTVRRALVESAGPISTVNGSWELHFPKTQQGVTEGIHSLAEPDVIARWHRYVEQTHGGGDDSPLAVWETFMLNMGTEWGRYDAAAFSAVYVEALAFSTTMSWSDQVRGGLIDWCTSFLSQLALETQQPLVSVIGGVPSRSVELKILDTVEETITEWSVPRGNPGHAVEPRCAFGNFVSGATVGADNGFELRPGHQYLLSAYAALHDGDWRRVFIDLGSALDIAAADLLRALRAAGGVSAPQRKPEMLGAKLAVLQANDWMEAELKKQLMDDVIYPRNDAVHDGSVPSPDAAKKAVLITEQAFRDVFSYALGAFLP